MKIDPERQHLHLLSLATWAELENKVAAVIHMTLMNDGAAVEDARAKAHDILDHHLDAKIASIVAIRENVGRNFRGE